MDVNSSAGQGGVDDSPFDVQGFKDLLKTLQESKKQQENKAKPVYNPGE